MAKVHPTTKSPKPVKDTTVIVDQPKTVPGRTLREMIANGFVLPTVEGRPRADGRPWSEIEGFEE